MRTALLLIFALAASLAAAPITNITLDCGSQSCTGPITIATVSVDSDGRGVRATADYHGNGTVIANVIARITLDDDFIFTLHGGTGIGQYTPCLTNSDIPGLSYVTASGSVASFGPVSTNQGNGSACQSYGLVFPIAYDTPTLLHLHLSASANVYPNEAFASDETIAQSSYGTYAYARAGAILVSEGATYTLVEASGLNASDVPEPASVLLIGLGLLAAAVVARRR